MGCSWQDHEGGRYLRVDYVGDPAEDGGVNVHATYQILAEPAGSTVRVLYDVRRGLTGGWDRGELAEGKRLARLNKEHCDLRVAVVGARGPMVALLRGMSAVTGYAVVACRDEASALEYLFRR